MSFYCQIQFAPFSRCALQLNVSRFNNEHTLQIVYSLLRSCWKTVLVRVFPYDKPEKAVTTYAILDEHSNKTLACSELVDLLGVDSPSTGYP
jgi:hypothetical protein